MRLCILHVYYTHLVDKKEQAPSAKSYDWILEGLKFYNEHRLTWGVSLPVLDLTSKGQCNMSLVDKIKTNWDVAWSKRMTTLIKEATFKAKTVEQKQQKPEGTFLNMLKKRAGKTAIRKEWEQFFSYHVAKGIRALPKITRKKRKPPTPSESEKCIGLIV